MLCGSIKTNIKEEVRKVEEGVRDGLLAVVSFCAVLLAAQVSSLSEVIGVPRDNVSYTMLSTLFINGLLLYGYQRGVVVAKYALVVLFGVHMLSAFALVAVSMSMNATGNGFVLMASLLCMAMTLGWYRTVFSEQR